MEKGLQRRLQGLSQFMWERLSSRGWDPEPHKADVVQTAGDAVQTIGKASDWGGLVSHFLTNSTLDPSSPSACEAQLHLQAGKSQPVNPTAFVAFICTSHRAASPGPGTLRSSQQLSQCRHAKKPFRGQLLTVAAFLTAHGMLDNPSTFTTTLWVRFPYGQQSEQLAQSQPAHPLSLGAQLKVQPDPMPQGHAWPLRTSMHASILGLPHFPRTSCLCTLSKEGE